MHKIGTMYSHVKKENNSIQNWPKTCHTIPPLILAPMAELTHAPFRQLVAEIGGCSVFYTEMINSRIAATQPLEYDPYCQRALIDRPVIAQIVGNDPRHIAISIGKLEKMGFDGFDINMGCARKSVTRRGWGIALMEDLKQAELVVQAARDATRRPLFLKIRSGKEHDIKKLVSFAKRMEKLGVDAIILHPRSGRDGFKRRARWEEIACLVQSLKIPVIGNGDITSLDDALKMHEETKCNGIMIGRAALVRPWIFWEMVNGTNWPGKPIEILERMACLVQTLLPESIRAKRYFIFCSWFVRNWEFHHYLLRKINPRMDITEICSILTKRIKELRPPLKKNPFCVRL